MEGNFLSIRYTSSSLLASLQTSTPYRREAFVMKMHSLAASHLQANIEEQTLQLAVAACMARCVSSAGSAVEHAAFRPALRF